MLEFEMFSPRQVNSSGKSFRKPKPLPIPLLREIPWKPTEYVPLGTTQQLTTHPGGLPPQGGEAFAKVINALAALIQAYGGRLAVSVWKV